MRRNLKADLPPGPSGPVALQLLATWTRPAASLERLRKYGKRVTVWLPFQPPYVILSDPNEIKELFTAPPDAIHPGEGARVLDRSWVATRSSCSTRKLTWSNGD